MSEEWIIDRRHPFDSIARLEVDKDGKGTLTVHRAYLRSFESLAEEERKKLNAQLVEQQLERKKMQLMKDHSFYGDKEGFDQYCKVKYKLLYDYIIRVIDELENKRQVISKPKPSFDGLKFTQTYDQAQKLITEYESKQNPRLLEKMRAVKPHMQKVTQALSDRIAGMEDVAPMKTTLAMAINICGGLSLYLKEYEEARGFYEQSRQLALESGDKKEIVMNTNNLGTVALEQGDYEEALEQFQNAARYCSKLSFKDMWIRRHIERNIEMAKRRLRQ